MEGGSVGSKSASAPAQQQVCPLVRDRQVEPQRQPLSPSLQPVHQAGAQGELLALPRHPHHPHRLRRPDKVRASARLPEVSPSGDVLPRTAEHQPAPALESLGH